jgi:hypothetical protein
MKEDAVIGVIAERSAFVKLCQPMSALNNSESKKLRQWFPFRTPQVAEEQDRRGCGPDAGIVRRVELHFSEQFSIPG